MTDFETDIRLDGEAARGVKRRMTEVVCRAVSVYTNVDSVTRTGVYHVSTLIRGHLVSSHDDSRDSSLGLEE